MTADLSYTPLGQLCDPERGITYGIVKVGDFVSGGVPVIRGGDIRKGKIVFDDQKRVTEEISQQFQRTILRGGEIVINLIAEPGHTAIVPPELSGANVSRDVGVIALNDKVEHRYVDYCLKSPMAVRWLTSRLQGSVTQKINLGTLRELPIPDRPREVQRAIAHILGTLDAKVDLNRRTNETLEAMARTLFKSWFVDFDPVRAKAGGRRPSGMDAEIAKLFPSEFEESELGLIPRGWRVGTIGDLIEIHDAKRVPLSAREREQRRGKFPYYGATSVMDHVDDFLFDGIFVLIGEDGSVVTEAGYPFLQYVWGQFWVNNHAHVLTGLGGVSQEHLFLILSQTNIAAFVTGAVQAKLSQGNLRRIPTVVPPGEVSAQFGSTIASLFARFRSNVEETSTLTRARDELLPRLLSGELSVARAESAVEATA